MSQENDQVDSVPTYNTETTNAGSRSVKSADDDIDNAELDSASVSTPAPAYEEVDSTLKHSKEKTEDVKDVKNWRTLAQAAAKAMVCSIGPDTSFFYFPGETGTAWRFVNQMTSSRATISPALVSALNINWPYDVALSPYAAGYFAYQCSAGNTTWTLIPVTNAARPKKRKHRKAFDSAMAACGTLNSWLSRHVVNADDIRNTKVRFGLAGRFMAWKPDGTWIANDLPPTLQNELKRRNCGTETKQMPQLVTFGVDDTWAAIWHDGTHTVHLDGKYVRLSETIKEHSGEQLLHVSLDYGNKGTGHYARFDALKEMRVLMPCRSIVIEEGFDAMVRKWTAETSGDFAVYRKVNNIMQSRTVLNAEGAAKQSDVLTNEVAKPSVESSKKGVRTSHVVVAGGVLALAAGCTVM